jgi:SHS2 domain-containing protein
VFRWVEHTSELELELETPTAEDAFAEALAALAELLGDGPGAPLSREVVVEGSDLPTLLAAWLDELVFLAETDGFVPERLERIELGDTELRAVVRGHAGDPPHLVKAVTYHGLELGRRDGGWHARVVLDV